MSGLGLIVSIVSLLLALVAVRWVWRLREELSDLKREKYFWDQKLKALSGQIELTVEPLRVQMAQLALGKPVSEELIRKGKLYHEITAKEAEGILKDGPAIDQVLWLDVSTNPEFSKQHIPGAILIPVEDLERRYLEVIPQDIPKVMVYCSGGDRSQLACDFLSRHGFSNVYYIKDGLQGWTGPLEGTQAVGLITITSKSKIAHKRDVTMSTSISSS